METCWKIVIKVGFYQILTKYLDVIYYSNWVKMSWLCSTHQVDEFGVFGHQILLQMNEKLVNEVRLKNMNFEIKIENSVENTVAWAK